MDILTQYIELGGIAGLFALFIVQYFQYQKVKSNPMNGTGKAILTELQNQNSNHLEHLQRAVEKLNDDANDWHRKQFEVLVEIKAILQERR
jgi:hypothetical protein